MFGLSTLEEAISFASQMAKANLLPAHLKGSPADCLRVVMQAARWQMDPFAVADKTSVINGKMMHEGQLVMAVINARGNMSKKLNYSYVGEGDNRVLTVTGTIRGEDEPRTIELPFSLAKRINKNGQMGLNPDQQAAYIGARLWARKHTPELMMGVYTPDEIDPDEPLNVTPGAAGAPETRPAPPPRATTGAAAVQENAAKKIKAKPKEEKAIDVETTPATEAPAAEKPAEKATPATATKEPVTKMEQNTVATFVCTVGKVVADIVNNEPSVKAELTGEFAGLVYHIKGATQERAGLACVPLPAWKEGNAVRVELLARPNTKGAIFYMVQKVERAEQVDQGAQTAGESTE